MLLSHENQGREAMAAGLVCPKPWNTVPDPMALARLKQATIQGMARLNGTPTMPPRAT